MRDKWLIAVMFAALAGMVLAGCASRPQIRSSRAPDESKDAVVSAPQPKDAPLHLVEKRPSPRRYRFVGLVRGTSQSGDLVEAAKDARADLRRQAARLKADVIKLDIIAPPNDSRTHRHLIFAGRAYQEISRTN